MYKNIREKSKISYFILYTTLHISFSRFILVGLFCTVREDAQQLNTN